MTRTYPSPFLTPLSVALLLLLNAAPATAQRRGRDPHLAYAFPAGCQRGTESEIVVGGQHLKDATEIYLEGEDVDIEIIGWYRPLSRGEYTNLRMKIQETKEALIAEREAAGQIGEPTDEEVMEAAGVTEEQRKEMEIYRQRDRDPKRQPNEQLEEQVTLRLVVAKQAEPGKRELRFLTDGAISNPIWLHIGRWHEVKENEPNDRVFDADDAVDALPVVINGQIMPGDTDRFAFEATKGSKLVIDVAARDVIPFLADAVPGWFQAIVRLTDSAGNEVSYADSFHYRQDPVLYFEVPRDDRYTIEIRDTLYRGREDFVYRITLGEIPFVTSVFPLGASVDSEVTLLLNGWNLTDTQLPIKTMSRKQYRPTRWYTSQQSSGVSIRFPVQIDYWQEVFDEEPNDNYENAQTIKTPVTVNGRIDQAGDEDIFRIAGGGRLVAEVHARRLGSPVDSILRITDETGQEIAFNDDHKDITQALQTHHADSHLSVALPAGSNYFLHLSDAQRKGGPDFSYRLSLRAPQADFELRVVPASIIARAGQVVPITVFVMRRDGFAEDIAMRLINAPEGFLLGGSLIPGSVDKIRMTLTVPKDASEAPVALEMEGVARRRSRSRSEIVRPAIPAENMMQAFIWYHLVTVENWNVIVNGRPGAKLPFSVAMPRASLQLPRGGDYLLKAIPASQNIKPDDFHVELSEPPAGLSASILTDPSGAFGIKITTEEEEIEPGLRGNLIFSVYKEETPKPTEQEPEPKPRRTDYGYLPAIPFEVAVRKTSR
ncbi:peptidase [Novipirellula artificiosorum]|uniref:Subtilase-type serine protease n=1 Tax=Novipirellula artificiosorum TaxID=2528016 RepID=A0A5C6DK82_9BACT|nr:peptidase [Novipirellula artificiosorum]TWU36011.1 hypothetical protein Poly41_37630 [Novipirellula artificiosorum]